MMGKMMWVWMSQDLELPDRRALIALYSINDHGSLDIYSRPCCLVLINHCNHHENFIMGYEQHL